MTKAEQLAFMDRLRKRVEALGARIKENPRDYAAQAEMDRIGVALNRELQLALQNVTKH